MSGQFNVTDTARNTTAGAWLDVARVERLPPGLILTLRVVLFGFFCLGVVGNLLTLVTIARTRSLRSVPNVYLCNLAAADLILCTVSMPAAFVGYTVTIPHALCVVLGHMVFTCFTVTLMSITMVAVNRYVLVVRERLRYEQIYTPRNVKLSITTLWLLGALYGMPPHFGFGEYEYNDRIGGCMVGSSTLGSWLFLKIFGAGLCLFPTMSVSLYCYVNIGLAFRRARLKVASAPADQAVEKDAQEFSQQTIPTAQTSIMTTANSEASKRRATVSLLQKLAVVWGLFMCCWLPATVLHSADFDGHRDIRVMHVAFVVAQCNSAVNVLTYGALSHNIRAAYRRTLCCQPA